MVPSCRWIVASRSARTPRCSAPKGRWHSRQATGSGTPPPRAGLPVSAPCSIALLPVHHKTEGNASVPAHTPRAPLPLHGTRRLHASYDSPLAVGRQGVIESLRSMKISDGDSCLQSSAFRDLRLRRPASNFKQPPVRHPFP